MNKVKQTPAMKQYWNIKEKHSDCILLFRMGDFYETFQDDAEIASEILGITLTKRANGAASSVPLAGFPYHALDQYAYKLLNKGYRVAICEQVEDPKQSKGIVKREVVEILSPGTAISEKFLKHNQNNYLGSIIIKGRKVGITFIDNSTGDFFGGEWDVQKGLDLINTYNINEIIISEKQYELFDSLLNSKSYLISTYQNWISDFKTSYDKIKSQFKVKTLKGFGLEDRPLVVMSAAASLFYIEQNHKNSSNHIQNFRYQGQEDFMHLDTFTIQNLELFKSNSETDKKASLIEVMDKTKTAGGARLLKNYLKSPLIDKSKIKSRQDRISEIMNDDNLRYNFSDLLNSTFDIERIISRISSNKTNPRDLINLKNSLVNINELKKMIKKSNVALSSLKKQFVNTNKVIDRVKQTIDDDCSVNMSNGGYIRDGFSNELDNVRKIANNSKQWLVDLQKKEQTKNNIPSLKIKYNKVFGYYIEVTKAHASKIPDYFIRKQTLVNAERYYTEELKSFEDTILSSNEKLLNLENKIFDGLVSFIIENSKSILINASILSKFDVSNSLAELAHDNNYCRPKFYKQKKIELIDSRHPVVETLIPIEEPFIYNDVQLNTQTKQIAVITGPNMAGKSTFLRQVALISIMAQVGSYVPAKKANICIVDKVYTRVGANDNLADGESTFLVEMNETANILNNATSNSLIILDEIGRGTSTFDGLAIAWSIVEFLHKNGNFNPITLFATHYHELVGLANQLDRAINLNIEVLEEKGELIFLRKVVPGGANQSYGVHVAQMAGLPKSVINRAHIILRKLVSDKKTNLNSKDIDQLELEFYANRQSDTIEELKEIDIDNMTPLEALFELKKLKEKYGE